jgi:hypothetical protein
MYSVRAFLSLWSVSTLAILGYAAADLGLHPALRRETNFSMQPDLSRLPELVHWGGRLVKEGHWSLLVSNAFLLGGLAALLLAGVARRFQREQPATAKVDPTTRPRLR